jgi:hypothetical protein
VSTHSYIGMEKADGSVSFIYCHFDGYPAHQVPLLTQNWTVREDIEALLKRGDINGLGIDLQACELIDEVNEDSKIDSVQEYGEFASSLRGSYTYLYTGGSWKMHDRSSNAWISLPQGTPS